MSSRSRSLSCPPVRSVEGSESAYTEPPAHTFPLAHFDEETSHWNCPDCRHSQAHVSYWKSRLQALSSPRPRSTDQRRRANSPDELYRVTTCEETAKFERVASILAAYRLSLARWEQVEGSDRFNMTQIDARWQALIAAEEMVALVANQVEALTPASRQLFLIFTHELQRREVDNGLERLFAFRHLKI